jgi:HlyD family secretion protein
MRGKGWVPGAVLAAVAVAAFAVFLAMRSRPVTAPAPVTQPPPPNVETSVGIAGKVRPQTTLTVTAPVEGNIEQVMVEAGQEVFAGQLLAKIRNGRLFAQQMSAKEETEQSRTRAQDLEAQLQAARLEDSRSAAAAARARNEYEAAEKDYFRQKSLDEAGATPHLVFLKAKNDYDAARADAENRESIAKNGRARVTTLTRELEDAQATLREKTDDFVSIESDAEIHSPADGILIAQTGKPGDHVSPASGELFQIAVNLSLLEVVLQVDDKTRQRIKAGQGAVIRIAEAGDIAISGTVRNTPTPQGQVLVGFESPSPAVKPGMMALVQLAETRKR